MLAKWRSAVPPATAQSYGGKEEGEISGSRGGRNQAIRGLGCVSHVGESMGGLECSVCVYVSFDCKVFDFCQPHTVPSLDDITSTLPIYMTLFELVGIENAKDAKGRIGGQLCTNSSVV